jgi:lysozyme family protein
MASYSDAWQITKANEGGYVFDRDDLGGETYRGISRVFHPGWNGWKVIDAIKAKQNIPFNYSTAALDSLAAAYHYQTIWTALNANYLNSQPIANVLFDSAFSGYSRSNNMVKDILNKYFKQSFKLNGTLDTNVISTLNSINEKKFIKHFNTYRRKLFKFSAGRLSSVDPLYSFFKRYNKASEQKKKSNEKFLSGWIARVDKYGSGSGGALTAVIILAGGYAASRYLRS